MSNREPLPVFMLSRIDCDDCRLLVADEGTGYILGTGRVSDVYMKGFCKLFNGNGCTSHLIGIK
jgi:hypothetical protein